MQQRHLLFFTKGEPTKEIWYYDLSDINITKKQPLTVQQFDEFFKLFPKREDSERSWKVKIEDIQAKNYDIKAVNPNRKVVQDTRTPQELIAIIESQGEEISKTLAKLKNKGI
ncbi:MAG: N-6 DNA methylase [Candidatus Omnitrophota bacterium]|nr:N-6 DNA methylase [Candidatus Omnitrophota bacterium]